MKKCLVLLFVVSCSLKCMAQPLTHYRNCIDVVRSTQYGFSSAYLLTGCPQTNEYQEVEGIDDGVNGLWERKETKGGESAYMVMSLDSRRLSTLPCNFRVSISFGHTPKAIRIDFSPWKNADGSWKAMPAYDKKSEVYKNYTRRNGDFIVPGNKEIVAISKQLLQECDSNLLAYAYECYLYVAGNYQYMNPLTGMHPLTKILKEGGGDCGNLSSIYISLLRAQGIPARHVQAITVGDYHIWSEFYIQDFGWVPVDVTFKRSNPRGDFFGRYNGNWVVVQRDINQKCDVGNSWRTAILLQQVYWWFWYDTPATLSAKQHLMKEE